MILKVVYGNLPYLSKMPSEGATDEKVNKPRRGLKKESSTSRQASPRNHQSKHLRHTAPTMSHEPPNQELNCEDHIPKIPRSLHLITNLIPIAKKGGPRGRLSLKP